MNRVFIVCLLVLSTFIFCYSQQQKAVEDPVAVKFYYLDTLHVNAEDTTYSNGHIKLIGETDSEYFDFTTPEKFVEIYYDHAFSHIAEKIRLTLKDSSIWYRQFDRKGNLDIETFRKNGHNYGQQISYKNSKREFVTTYTNNGNEISDSSFYENGKPQHVVFHKKNYSIYKELNFYRNGEVSEEIFNTPDPNDQYGDLYYAVFTIRYDSLTHEPNMFYNNDTTWEDTNNPGTFIGYTRLIPAGKAIVKEKKQTQNKKSKHDK